MFDLVRDGKLESTGFMSPSILNMEAFAGSVSGNTFADFLFGYESLGIWGGSDGVYRKSDNSGRGSSE